MFYLHFCLYTLCVLGALGGQKSVSNPLELELNMIMSGHVGSGNQTWFLWKSNQCAPLTAESHLTAAPLDIYLVTGFIYGSSIKNFPAASFPDIAHTKKKI